MREKKQLTGEKEKERRGGGGRGEERDEYERGDKKKRERMNKDRGIKRTNGFKNLKVEPDVAERSSFPPKGFLHTKVV